MTLEYLNSERTYNSVSEEVPLETIFDSQREESTHNQSTSDNSLAHRDQRPTRAWNEPTRLAYYAPGYYANNVGIGPAHAFPSFHGQPYYCTPYFQ